MKLYHCSTTANLESIQTNGLRVQNADPAARIKAVWACSKSQIGWAILHTIRKHKAQLEDVVVIEVDIPRGQLTRFRTGLWHSKNDVAPNRLGAITTGPSYGASASE